jgi:hypothetical protein
MKNVSLCCLLLLVLTANSYAANIWAEPRTSGSGGTYVHIDGEIVAGDYENFINITAGSEEPIYVMPTGPGGEVHTAIAIGDAIWQYGFNTIINNVSCASACAFIWASGYSHHAIADYNADLRFHSYATNGQDNQECNNEIVQHYLKYGFTPLQARWAVFASHETTFQATAKKGAELGLRWQWLARGAGIR